MSGDRVDLEDLRTLAMAALESARARSDRTGPEGQAERGAERWILAPRRDSLVDVVVTSSGADVFDRTLLVDAAFAVAAQPAVVVALLDRIAALEAAARAIADAPHRHAQQGRIALMRSLLEQGVVLP